MNAHLQQDILPPLTPEQFGLTQERIRYFEEKSKPKLWTFLVPIGLNFLMALFAFDYGFPRVHPPILVFLFVALFPGFIIGNVIEGRRNSRVQTCADYKNYVNYLEALRAHRDLGRKLRWEQIKAQREKEKKAKLAEEWWRGMDGKGFELEVAKVLLSKGYNVRHVGGTGDEGVDLVVKHGGKRIIVQCKAFRNYVSAGVVRELYGTLIHQKADEAWVVVSSGFYSGAKAFASGKPIRLITAKQLKSLPAANSVPEQSAAQK